MRGVGPGYFVQGPSLLRTTDSQKSAPNSSSAGCKERNLSTLAVAKRHGQSSSSFDSLCGQSQGSFDKKRSLRFGSERPVDAHFRFGLKTAPTPNEAKPRLHFFIEAAPTQAEQLPKASTRLSQRCGSDAPSNFVSKRLLSKSATDRRQPPPASRKIVWSINIDSRIQQERRQLISIHGTSTAASRVYSITPLEDPAPTTSSGVS